MGFLGDLGDAISSQFGLATNNTTTLDAVVDGQNVKYGSLGDFASQFDQSAERRYVEEGYLRPNPYHSDPKQFEVLWQEPNATVLVKKRMFSSIAENYRPDFMDGDEKLYYKAMCLLFQNKCTQIAALEQLSKIQQVTSAVGSISQQLVPIIITLADQVNNGYASANGFSNFGGFNIGNNPLTTQGAGSFFQVVERLRTLFAYNQTAQYTTWITDPSDMFQSTFGPGSGVIEITNFTSINTSTSVDLKSPGNFQLSISDPYEAMLITDYDIELALSDATNSYYNSKAVQLGAVSANQTITMQQNMLNAARANRNASPITFKVTPNTILGQQVIAIIDRLGLEIPFTYDALGSLLSLGLGSSVNVPADYLRGGALAGYDGLDTGTLPIGPNQDIKPLFGSSEQSLFNAIITSTFQQITLLQNTSKNLAANYDQTNYARRKLRTGFSGKLIIQPMDTVHIYMNSKSQYDNKLLAGLQQMFTGFGVLNNLTTMFTSEVNALDTLLNPGGNISVQAEKSIYVGPNFPDYLWQMMRSQFVSEIEGTHVFAGIVDSAVDNWSVGKFTVNVSGKDNTAYFDQGKVNFKPGVDSFNGLIFDPLTPFKSSWDSFSGTGASAVTSTAASNTPQLLDENAYLLGDTPTHSMVKYKLGSLAGEKATQGNYIQDQNIDPITGHVTRLFYAPDGLTYKWKQGIGIFTQAGSSNYINDPNLVGNPNIFAEPFAGLDVMNVLSLLVTGIPYNYATYFKASSNLNGFASDPNSKQSPTYSYMSALQSGLSKRNVLWGNFIPFKTLTMNESAIAQFMQAQLTASNINSDLDAKIQKLNDLQNALVGTGAVNALSTVIKNQSDPSIGSYLSDLQSQVTNLRNDINQSIQQLSTQTSQLNSQVTTGPADATNYITNGVNDPSDSEARRTIRREINYLTRRMSYDVRANQDKNLFIVDDYYDVDYDIAAFNSALTDGIKQYSNEFTSIREKIMNVSDLLNLEVFADSQGHIRVRPPQYNRVPSSVFYDMLYQQQTLKIQVFPQFLNSLFTNQISSLATQIEIIEDQIRLQCAILGQYPSADQSGDGVALHFIVGSNTSANNGATFLFISDSTDTITDISLLLQQANQEVAVDTVSQGLGKYGQIKAAGTTTKQLFTNVQRYTALNQALQGQIQIAGGTNVNSSPTTSIFQNSVVQQLITRISTKSGQTISSQDYLTQANPNQPIEVNTGQVIDFFKVTNELTQYINQWQNQVKLFYHTCKNMAEYQSLNVDSSIANILQGSGQFIQKNKYIPQVYEHMIEDETYDDYGLDSGKRYVITNAQIRSLSISENPPPWTTVEVQGTLPFFKENEGPPGLQNFPGGGNGLVTALAIDYDMWRNYGFKEPAVLKVPFLNDPLSQCGPYAAMVLTRNRSNILRGNCTISGNEYMQPGEVIYLQSRNLLFYVNSVKHSFAEGGSFTTSLDLTYGHSVGEYIPTYLDTIGKVIFKNRDTVDTIIQRQDTSGSEQNLGVVQLSGQQSTTNTLFSGSENSQVNDFTSSNQTVINNILYTTAPVINANGSPGNNVTAKIELRIYYDNSTGVNGNLQSAANNVLNELNGTSQGIQSISTANQPVQNTFLNGIYIGVSPVNLDDQTDRRSPSQQALDAARNQAANASMNTGSPSSSNPQNGNTGSSAANLTPNNTVLRTALFSYIIDCWITFTPVPSTMSSGSTANPV
jgi:hypothetical protein